MDLISVVSFVPCFLQTLADEFLQKYCLLYGAELLKEVGCPTTSWKMAVSV